MYGVRRLKWADGNSLWPDLAPSLILQLLYILEQVSLSAWRPLAWRGLNSCNSFHSQAVLLLHNNNISIVIGTNSWVSMAICHIGLSPVFSWCNLRLGWLLALLLLGRETKETKHTGVLVFLVALVQSVGQEIAMEFVSFVFYAVK